MKVSGDLIDSETLEQDIQTRRIDDDARSTQRKPSSSPRHQPAPASGDKRQLEFDVCRAALILSIHTQLFALSMVGSIDDKSKASKKTAMCDDDDYVKRVRVHSNYVSYAHVTESARCY
jgi:hypothetical protein